MFLMKLCSGIDTTGNIASEIADFFIFEKNSPRIFYTTFADFELAALFAAATNMRSRPLYAFILKRNPGRIWTSQNILHQNEFGIQFVVI